MNLRALLLLSILVIQINSRLVWAADEPSLEPIPIGTEEPVVDVIPHHEEVQTPPEPKPLESPTTGTADNPDVQQAPSASTPPMMPTTSLPTPPAQVPPPTQAPVQVPTQIPQAVPTPPSFPPQMPRTQIQPVIPAPTQPIPEPRALPPTIPPLPPVKPQTLSPAVSLDPVITTPGSIRKVFLIVNSLKNFNALNRAARQLKNKVHPKFLVVESESSKLLKLHINLNGQLNFLDFVKSVRQDFPFKPEERRIYLTEAPLVDFTQNTSPLAMTNAENGIGVISTGLLSQYKPKNNESSKISESYKKLLLSSLSQFYGINSKCGVLTESTTVENLISTPEEFCSQDLDLIKSFQFLK